MDAAVEPVEPYEEPGIGRLARIGLGSGCLSLALLGVAIAYVHHWNPISAAIVGAWAITLTVALVASGRAIARGTKSRRIARWGLTLCVISLIALAVAGLAFAAGADPAGA